MRDISPYPNKITLLTGPEDWDAICEQDGDYKQSENYPERYPCLMTSVFVPNHSTVLSARDTEECRFIYLEHAEALLQAAQSSTKENEPCGS